MSSIEASPDLYASDDWQLIKHTISYNAVKYQIDILGTQLDRIALETPDSEKRIRHVVVHPGIASTPFSNKLVNFWTNVLKVVLMYIVGHVCPSVPHLLNILAGALVWVAKSCDRSIQSSDISRIHMLGADVNTCLFAGL